MIREDSEIASLARKAWKRSARRIVELPSLPERLAYQRMQLRGSLQPHLAGLPEDNVTLVCSRCSFRRTPCLALRRMLANADLDRLPPQVRAVQLQQVEGIQKRLRLVPAGGGAGGM